MLELVSTTKRVYSDFNRSEITIKRQLNREGLKNHTKSHKIRVIPMTSKVKEMLLNRFETRKNFDYVFTKENGSHIDYEHFSRRHFYPALEKSKVRKINFKHLRSTFACHYCMRKQGSIFELSKILGHHSVVITERNYARFHPDYLKKGMETFSIDILDDSPILAPVFNRICPEEA